MINIKFIRLVGFALALGLAAGLFTACANKKPKADALGAPQNVKIEIAGRTMTVTWDAVENAQGYEVSTASAGCNSGNKLINTKENTATNLEGAGEYLKDDKSNGAVEIINATTIQITLMPAKDDEGNIIDAEPMTSEVSAKVKALNEHLSSEYSSPTKKTF